MPWNLWKLVSIYGDQAELTYLRGCQITDSLMERLILNIIFSKRKNSGRVCHIPDEKKYISANHAAISQLHF